jgi:phenylpropionate dioxygenase-like ring-hydroxylating dioxygenase large terminal subunit
MFLRNCWYVAGWNYEVKAGQLAPRSVIGVPLLFYRLQDGRVVALEDRCCHRKAPLSLGRLEGDNIRCMYHGLKFDSTGKCIEIPGQETIPSSACVRTFPVVERHSWLWVWMGDRARADENLIPPAVGLDDPRWTIRTGQLDYDAGYLLVNDNLCDLSHIAYAHEKTFGVGDDQMAKTRPTVKTLPRGIRVQRWTIDAPVQEYDVTGTKTQDFFMTYDYLAPGVFLMRSETHPPGTAVRVNYGEPEGEPYHANFTSQAITPMTTGTSRYFFSWGPRASEAVKVPELPDNMFSLAQRAFAEDKAIIEGQQRNLDINHDDSPLIISHDRGPSLMRAIMRRLMDEESQFDPEAAEFHRRAGRDVPLGWSAR